MESGLIVNVTVVSRIGNIADNSDERTAQTSIIPKNPSKVGVVSGSKLKVRIAVNRNNELKWIR